MVAATQAVTAPVAFARGVDRGGHEGVRSAHLTNTQVLRLSARAEAPVGEGAAGSDASARPLEEKVVEPPGEDGEASVAPSVAPIEPAPRIPPPAPRVSAHQERQLRIAVGLSEDAAGSQEELGLVDALEGAMEAAEAPTAEVRRLRSGAAVARRVCAEGRDDLVITVGYLPDRESAVVFTYDCLLGRELGVRSAQAASSDDLLRTLWDEHQTAVADGAVERRRGRLNPKVRAGLIAGGALLAIGVAVGFVLASTLRDEVTVITVSP
jgi:hypothetical protein